MSYYVTTPIYYANATPHLGHAYTTIAADVVSRFQRLIGEDSFFLTGTDEHGAKLAEAAAAAGEDVQAFVDRNSQRFRDLLPVLDVGDHSFIRTTDPAHKAYVQQVLAQLHEQGDIYSAEYSGLYCTGCEAYYVEADLIDGTTCPIHKTPVTSMQETNWFFRLSAYQERLATFLHDNPDWVQPRSRYNEALSFIERGLEDLSISRSSITWGVEVPWDPSHVFYVWIDALFNYRSALGFVREGDDVVERYWPPALQLLAKDILKFHAVIWPALLMAAGLELPRRLFIHGYLTMGGDKMSKSLGNVFDPFPVIEAHGPDPVRFYVLREVQFGADGAVSQDGFERRYDTELANDLGNLVSRSASMLVKYRGDDEGVAQVPEVPSGVEFARSAAVMIERWKQQMTEIDLSGALETVWTFVRELNRHVEERAPWKLAKDPAHDQLLETTLGELAEGLMAVAYALSPVMPATSGRIAATFGVTPEELAAWRWGIASGRDVTKPEPLFPRLERVTTA